MCTWELGRLGGWSFSDCLPIPKLPINFPQWQHVSNSGPGTYVSIPYALMCASILYVRLSGYFTLACLLVYRACSGFVIYLV